MTLLDVRIVCAVPAWAYSSPSVEKRFFVGVKIKQQKVHPRCHWTSSLEVATDRRRAAHSEGTPDPYDLWKAKHWISAIILPKQQKSFKTPRRNHPTTVTNSNFNKVSGFQPREDENQTVQFLNWSRSRSPFGHRTETLVLSTSGNRQFNVRCGEAQIPGTAVHGRLSLASRQVAQDLGFDSSRWSWWLLQYKKRKKVRLLVLAMRIVLKIVLAYHESYFWTYRFIHVMLSEMSPT